VKTHASLTARADDLRAVLDAARVGDGRAVLVGFSEGAPVALTFAAAHPGRVRGLVLVGGFVRMVGHDAGWTAAELDALRTYAKTAWGSGATVRAMFPGRDDDEELRRWAAHVEVTGASPGAALDLLEMNVNVDARDALPRVESPAIVLHHRDDRVIRVENGRELARGLRHVRYVEASGSDHVFAYEDSELLASAIEELTARTTMDGSNAAK
jgi:pimeloyl-ACP methyl ester carboxylesterase